MYGTSKKQRNARKISLWRRSPVQSAGITLIVLWVAGAANIITSLNRAVSDQHARWSAAMDPRRFPANLLVIGIDDASVRKYGRLRNWSRSRYALLLNKTRSAKVVGLDILLTEPDVRDPQGDIALADAIRDSKNVVLPAFLYNEVRPVTDETQAQTARFLARLPEATPDAPDAFPSLNPQTLEPPLPSLTEHALALSQASVNADPDNVYRRPVVSYVTLDKGHTPRYVPHVTAAVASMATGKTLPELFAGTSLEGGAVILRSLTRRGGSLREGIGTPVPYLSFVDAVQADTKTFAGKVILVGETVTGTTDVRPNAIDNGLRGVELNAEIVANLMGAFPPLRDFPMVVSMALVGLVVAIPIRLFVTAPLIRSASIGSAGTLLGAVVLMECAHFAGGWVPPWAEVLTAFTAATLTAGIGRAGQEAARRRQLQDQFSAYVAPEQVEELLRNPDALFAGMKRTRCAILFSDIRGFTAYSEQNPPETVDRQMSEYLTEMSAAVFARLNFLDKFIGDAVMALFGDLLPDSVKRENYAAEAVLCGMDMLSRLDRLNEGWRAEGLPVFRIGVGIHFGEVLFGNVGAMDSEVGIRRLQLTALGDSVNLAARLQTATKEYKTFILVSGDVKDRAEGSDLLAGKVVWHDLGTLIVRGREKETPIWAVERLAPEISEELDGFEES
ncbi:MAG: adenylate/guanylate cyclase domain-containing protein [Akkermansiaceae bacterium]|nr:adenylate/guanylate cyclase domain-containing protein [Armatimonadota bacterium]